MRIYDNEVAIQFAQTKIVYMLEIFGSSGQNQINSSIHNFSKFYLMSCCNMSTCNGDIAAGLIFQKSKFIQRLLQFFGTLKICVATRCCNYIRYFTRLFKIGYSNKARRSKHMCNSTKMVIDIEIDNG
jgi:hypothetical protein